MRELAQRAARHGIAIHALVYDVGLGDKMSALGKIPTAIRELHSHLDVVPAFEETLRAILRTPPLVPQTDSPPASAVAATGGSRTLAWSLLAGGLVLGALGAFALVRRRAPTAGRAS
jgi:hypothetical protein